MRGLDTNVLARYVLADDLEQARTARDLIEGAEEQGDLLYISVIALCELVWVLRSAPHRLDRSAIAEVLQILLDTSTFEVQDRDLVRRALAEFRDGSADFPDYLLGWVNQRAGCQDTVTFDRKLRGAPGFSWLA
jgi:predicted nucleic-acid-binding protein